MKLKNLQVIATQIHLLGHVKRLEIITLLQGHSLTVGQIAKMIDLRQATVSQHLTSLRRSQLVKAEKSGKEVYYTLSQLSFTTLADFFHMLAKSQPANTTEPVVVDPICHMHLTPNTAIFTSSYNGVRHYFCGKGCLKEFHASH